MTGPTPQRLPVALVTLGAALLAPILIACSGPGLEPFQGTEITSPGVAQPFELENQFGRRVGLSDYRGQVVVLTFLYTNCPDVCPLTTSLLRDTYDLLGEDSEEVALMAVSVDPERDSVETAYRISERWEMLDKWDFLVGDRDTLSEIWGAYYLDPAVSAQDGGHAERGAAGDLKGDVSTSYLVVHSAPVYLIDREGMTRSLFTLPFEPEALAHDVRLLLK